LISPPEWVRVYAVFANKKIGYGSFNVVLVGVHCQGWGREFESRFPLQILRTSPRAGFLLYGQ
ncbi:hypothetical protein, partial [Marinospirillum sp.]|uniref:hypothetical protein n=1 Tax=Marinospirillum sp. TaxID=2183934 RepID=UPI0025BE1503